MIDGHKIGNMPESIEIMTYRAPYGKDPVGRAIASGRQEIELITDGRGWFENEGSVIEAVRGAVLWHLPGEVTIYRNDPVDPYECLVFIFPYAEGEVRPAPRYSRWADPIACAAFAEEVMKRYHGEKTEPALLARYVFATLQWQAHAYAGSSAASGLPEALRRALDLIEKDFAGPLSVARIAETVGLSVPHLHALFKLHLGIGPHRRLVDVRLAEARKLLASTNRPIKEIAYDVGCSDPVSFCKLFRTRCGTTPAVYRLKFTRKDGS
jgi:AraC-like DNA-binding protein